MLSCREVTRLVASEQLPAAGLVPRLKVRLHLLMCQHCRKYVMQLRLIGRAAHRLTDGDPEAAAAVQRVKERLGIRETT